MEEPVGTKINRIRTEEAVKSGSEVVVTACPFCLQMFDEGIRAKELDKTFKVMDLAEIVEENMTFFNGHDRGGTRFVASVPSGHDGV